MVEAVVNIEPEDVLDELSDKYLLKEIDRRGLEVGRQLDLQELYSLLVANRVQEAICILERFVLPKT